MAARSTTQRGNGQPLEILAHFRGRDLSLSLEELENRLEAQIAGLPSGLDDENCLYYLCTTRCSATKCAAFCACDIVVDLAGTSHGL